MRNPELYQYDLDLPEVAEVWRRGSVISSWLLDLTAEALHGNADLKNYTGRVSDSGEGRWTIAAAIDEGVPVPVIDRKSVVAGKSVSVRLDLGGRRILKKKQQSNSI